MIMDWREFGGLSTVSVAAANGVPGGLMGLETAKAIRALGRGAVSGLGDTPGVTIGDLSIGLVRVVAADPMRGWVVALGWVLASLVDVVYLYHLIRRPTHILDFSLTLIFNHLILTTYFSGHFPTSFFFWIILTLSTVAQVVLAEQCCVARDMHEGFSLADPSQTPSLNFHTPNPLYPPTPTVHSTSLHGERGKEDVELGHMRGASPSSGAGKHARLPSASIGGIPGGSGSGGRGYERIPTDDR